jgi:NAD(P)-dependent dehydrogenase (short-subunit alcohol dehydrogenase family)
MSRLQNKVTVITGGTSGIGLAAAQRFVAEGAFVYIFARRREELDKTVAAIGGNVTGVQGDVRKLEDLDRLYAKVASDGRKLDVVVANVGAVDAVKLGDVTIESFNHNFEVNARGVLFTVQKSLPLLNKGASVILTSTIAAVRGFPGRSAYAASKAALRSYARTWTMELKDRRIRVNTITPGPLRHAADRRPGQFACGGGRRARQACCKYSARPHGAARGDRSRDAVSGLRRQQLRRRQRTAGRRRHVLCLSQSCERTHLVRRT